MKSHFLAANTPVWIEVPEGQLIDIAVSGSKTCLECERSVNAKDKIPQKRKNTRKESRNPWRRYTHETGNKNLSKIAHTYLLKINLLKRKLLKSYSLKWNLLKSYLLKRNRYLKLRDLEYYLSTREIWDRNKFVVDNIFALNITRSNDNKLEPQTVEECWRRNDWPKWNLWSIWSCSPNTWMCNVYRIQVHICKKM